MILCSLWCCSWNLDICCSFSAVPPLASSSSELRRQRRRIQRADGAVARLFQTPANQEENCLAGDENEKEGSPGISPARRQLLQRTTLTAAAALSGALTAALASPLLLHHADDDGSLAALAYDNDEARRIAIFEKASPAVVYIDTFAERRDALTTNVMEVPLGSGSGFVWDKQGHIVTNFHVVRNANTAQVAILLTTPEAVSAAKAVEAAAPADSPSGINGATDLVRGGGGGGSSSYYSKLSRTSKSASGTFRKVFTAKVVGVDPGKDIAVLKIDADPAFLYPITVGTSTGLRVGQQALAIGNPFGLDHTLTSGIISGTGREIRSPIGRPITNVLQTDAAVNPGNSGGPLLDSSGRMVGMNTAIYSPSGASAGIGFAIPVDAVKLIVETLIKDGRVVRPILGISFLGSKQARTLGITSGVLVLEVPPDSPAAKAGLKGTRRTESGLIELGDIITKVNDDTIDMEADLFQALEDCKVGDTVTVTVNRLAAVNDELKIKVVKLQIQLQSSAQIEKNMQIFQYPSAPAPTLPMPP